MKRALITGITGQDGSYLAELLLERGYEVHGLVRRVALEDPQHRMSRLAHVHDRLHLHAGSLESFPSIYSVIAKVQPDELYHLAAQLPIPRPGVMYIVFEGLVGIPGHGRDQGQVDGAETELL